MGFELVTTTIEVPWNRVRNNPEMQGCVKPSCQWVVASTLAWQIAYQTANLFAAILSV